MPLPIFRPKYYYLELRTPDGQTASYFGPLKNSNKMPCRNESEAQDAAWRLAKGNLFIIRTSKHSSLATATQELKGTKFETPGISLKDASKRVKHQLPEDNQEEYVEL